MHTDCDIVREVKKVKDPDGTVTITRELFVMGKRVSPKWTRPGIILFSIVEMLYITALCLILIIPDLILKLTGSKGFIHLGIQKSKNESGPELSEGITSTVSTELRSQNFHIGILDCLEPR